MRAWNMIFLLLGLVPAVLCLSLNLKGTQASLYTNQKIVLKFVVVNASLPYSISYMGIPLQWITVSNDLVVSNYSLSTTQQWTFDMIVKDAKNQQLFQTVKMVLNGYQIELTPVTVGVLKKDVSTSPTTTKPTNNQNSQASAVPSSPYSYSPFGNNSVSGVDFDLQGLIESYPGLASGQSNVSAFGINYSNNSIITPQVIANAQATYDPARDGKKITEYEIRRNAAFFRQENAQKNVANMIFVVQRLNTNIDVSKQNIAELTQQRKSAKNSTAECNIEAFSLENTKRKIKNAVDDRNVRIKQFQIQIDINVKKQANLTRDLGLLAAQRKQYENTQPEGDQLSKVEDSLKKCTSTSAVSLNQIDTKNGIIQKNNIEVNLIQGEIGQSESRLEKVNSSLVVVRTKISDLKKELTQAIAEQQSLLKDQEYYSAIPKEGKAKIQKYKNESTKLQAQIDALRQTINSTTQKCKSYEDIATNIKNSIANKQQAYKKLNSDVNQKEADLQQVQKVTALLKDSISSLPLEIEALQMQLDKYETRLRQHSYLCSVNADLLSKIENSLAAQKANLAEIQSNLNLANRNLELARTEKEVADAQIEKIIAQSTSVLPYSIVPNGGSTILGGTPLGNNPSGSALGPAFRVDADSKGVITPASVGNLSSYLSQVYGMNIDPANLFNSKPSATTKTTPTLPFQFGSLLPGATILPNSNTIQQLPSSANSSPATSLTYIAELSSNAKLYPIDKQSKTKITSPASPTSGLSSFVCPNGGPVQSFEGILASVSLGSIIVRDILNQQYTLSLSACTIISSTKANIFFEKGSKVFFTGKTAFQVLGTVLFNAYSILIVPK